MLTSTIYFDKIIITKNIDKEMYVKMKSRKFKAVLAAVSAIAVLATAMTGFAATITTSTTYNLADATKASVTTTVSGLVDQDAEVTLLVKTAGDDTGVNGSGIAYIDQKPAEGGEASFTYQLNKATLGDVTAAVVTSGNGAGEAVTGSNTLGVTRLANVDETMYTITYTEAAYGAGDAIVHAKIEAKNGFEITDVTVGETSYGAGDRAIEVAPAAVINVAAQEVVTGPTIAAEDVTVDGADGVYSATAIIKVSGEYTEVGVEYKGFTFPAAGAVNEGGYIAVKLTNDTAFEASDIETYIVD